MIYRWRFFIVPLLLLVIFSVYNTPSLAQVKPFITLSPVWRPGTTLDTDLAVDRYPHYVDVEFYVQGNVQFWAVDITCNFNKTALHGYGVFPGGDPGDDVPEVRLGPDWGAAGQFIEVGAPGQGIQDGTGIMTFAASRKGTVTPLGSSGVNYSLLLATVRFVVDPLAANTTSTLMCSSMKFVDRNGVSVATAKQAKVPILTILTGYTISGKVTYQGYAPKSGIGVRCNSPSNTFNTTTDMNGNFKFPNLRETGTYTCLYFGNVLTPAFGDPDAFLGGRTSLNLNSLSFTLYPTVLNGGNTDQGTSPQDVGDADVTAVTSNWHTTANIPFTHGDATGDKKVDQTDLAIIAGNYGLNEGSPDNFMIYTHAIYSLPRDYTVLSNNHLWLGTPHSGAVTPLFTGTTRDFWPATSPDGSKIAFTRFNASTSRYDLYIAPTSGGAAVKLTPTTFTLNGFAPAWSPDGAHVAFVAADNGYLTDKGDVYTVDADGRNLTFVAPKSRIYPPAWFNNTVLVYAGYPADGPNPGNLTCPNTLCWYDFAANQTGIVSANLQFPGQIVDMPAIRFTGGTAYLFYRDNDGAGSRRIRGVVGLTYVTSGTGFNAIPSFSSSQHDDIKDNGLIQPLSTDVDYYTVMQHSDNLNIMYYETGGSNFVRSDFQFDFPSWGHDPAPGPVDGQVGNPSLNAGTGTLYALRNTVDWEP